MSWYKQIVLTFALIVGLTFNVSLVQAHAVVKPSTVGVGSFTDFSLGVPSEKALSTTAIKLILPPGLNSVSPIVKPGWKIDLATDDKNAKLNEDGELKSPPTEIIWSGGEIPSGQKDLFMFSAQVPAQEGVLEWKVEQTYSDGSTVSWSVSDPNSLHKDSSGKTDFSKFGPVSKTTIINDLKTETKPANLGFLTETSNRLAGLAFVISIVALVFALRKKS